MNKMKSPIKYIFYSIVILLLNSCSYLDVVPDNVATIDNAFTMRNAAEKFLFTCYRYLPDHAHYSDNPGFMGGDEIWIYREATSAPVYIARGYQNVLNPYVNSWDGAYRGIRDCNIFFENIEKVPDMTRYEKDRWISEVKFIKAYLHFYLLRMYGPIPVIRENMPIWAGPEEVKVKREPVDVCVDYIVELLDEAALYLPFVITDELTELGRITRPIALTLKAEVLVLAASPLFNGNPDYIGFTDNDGQLLFNTEYDEDKWKVAAQACRDAVELCEEVGITLYHFIPGPVHQISSEETILQLNVRNAVTEKWNSEIIWGNTNSMGVDLQQVCTPGGLDPLHGDNQRTRGIFAPPIKIAEMFYSKNGVPISEDKTYDYNGRFDLRIATEEEKYHLQPGYTTVGLHFDREQRFYTSLAFDGGIWYGQGRFDDNNQWLLQSKAGQYQSTVASSRYSVTGYRPKKLVNYENIIGNGSSYTIQQYPWPVMRLADLYLLYSEALNEVEGPTEEALRCINLVRERSGLQPVEEAWPQYSINPNKHTSKEGFREIIQQERLIELAFEGKRFWDLRRWKRAHLELNKPITGWDIDQESEEGYYRQRVLHNQTFFTKDYLWPIREYNITVNKNLVQNPGW